jgi:hypothetical protein
VWPGVLNRALRTGKARGWLINFSPPAPGRKRVLTRVNPTCQAPLKTKNKFVRWTFKILLLFFIMPPFYSLLFLTHYEISTRPDVKNLDRAGFVILGLFNLTYGMGYHGPTGKSNLSPSNCKSAALALN